MDHTPAGQQQLAQQLIALHTHVHACRALPLADAYAQLSPSLQPYLRKQPLLLADERQLAACAWRPGGCFLV